MLGTHRRRVIRALIEVHKVGVVHGNFNASHIVVKQVDGKAWPLIVGFSHARVHECPIDNFKGTLAIYGEHIPDHHLCDELEDVIHEVQIWYPSMYGSAVLCVTAGANHSGLQTR